MRIRKLLGGPSPLSSLVGLMLVVSGFSMFQNVVSFGVPACGSSDVLFSILPVELGDVVDLAPLGQLTPPDHVLPAPHNYVYVIDYQSPVDMEALVYAPGDMVLRHIGLRHYNVLGQYTNYTDYTLLFSVCSDFDLYFHHIRSLRYPPFVEAAQQVFQTCKFSNERNEEYCSGNVNIRVRAGEIVGTTGDLKGGVYGLDVGARDYRLSVGRSIFVNPDRYCRAYERNPYSRCYTVCAFDYFGEDIREQLRYSHMSRNVVRTEPPVCGDIYLDIGDTARGNWFRRGSTQSVYSPESNYLFLGPDNVSPSTMLFSVGLSVQTLSPGRYEFQPTTSSLVNKEFSNVRADGQVYCYQTRGQMFNDSAVIIIQLIDSTTLRVERAQSTDCGNGPWTFGLGYTDFER